MNVWLVNPFDPLPGEVEQLGRYARLAQALRKAGHRVTWWSSDFSHRFKRPVNQRAVFDAARAWNIDIRLLHAPSYTNNISPRRIWSHRKLAVAFNHAIKNIEQPDLVFASSPPLELAREAARYTNQCNIPSVIDIQDQWPDNFVRLFPKAFRWCAPLLLEPLYSIESDAYTIATAMTGVAQAYVDRGLSVGGAKRFRASFPLGLDLGEFDDAVSRGKRMAADRWHKPPGHIWLIYSGSLSYNYDVLTIVAAAERAAAEFGQSVMFLISGSGDLAAKVRDVVAAKNLTNVHILGFMDFPEWAYLLSQCDAGFNAAFPGALIYLPNKVFYYFAAGLAVLNTIPGECSSIVSDNQCGLDYTAGDPDSCFKAVHSIVKSADKLSSMRAASRRLAERRFDCATVTDEMVKFVERVAGEWTSTNSSRH